MLHLVSPHWQDPMQWSFLCATSFVRIITSFMRYAGVLCVTFGMGRKDALFSLQPFGNRSYSLTAFDGSDSTDLPRRRSLYARYYPHYGSHDVGGLLLVMRVKRSKCLRRRFDMLLCHLVVSVVLLFNIYFNYALCCATNPRLCTKGIITARWHMEETSRDEGQDETEDVDTIETGVLPRIRPTSGMLDGTNNQHHRLASPSVFLMDPQSVHVAKQRGFRPNAPRGSTSYCRTCRHDRPPRAHHCSVCKKCIAQLDHHCPWVNNCIGRDNYRYFFSLLVWLVLGCYYAAYMTYKAAYTELHREQHAKMLMLAQVTLLRLSAVNTLQLAFAMSAAAGLAVTILASWHAFLIATAQTSVELHINRSAHNRRLHGGKVVSPYSTGSIHGNWELVFGRCKYKLLSLLPHTHVPRKHWDRVRDATADHSPDTIT
ncbi:hypothetical protein PsorP6_016665 [Peronosclerospora sorghi]|uniref:Uncharacterized protein n=1 Tax=Peronosclerospora sorghi TaxID=230839 RepID=A0ACC0VSD8_9STRA|nr:hypothetical protein PsorP6_016665 [Peronosclerospora sorghi]